ncbi:MAG TPA: hypothetical protein PK544_05325 [Spirochaetota bacterium]|nr:hypothetical protein [Spirochaetota bacterium]HPJ38170.1 hypothetical protein [Spirochaetota bacterium]
MDRTTTQFFPLGEVTLYFDFSKSVLMCKSSSGDDQKLWAKKIPDVVLIDNIIEDDEKYYVACEYSEKDGMFLALAKDDGTTQWYIPGRSHLQVLYEGFLYLIFIDERERYYFIKVEIQEGRKIWHHEVEIDLSEYRFSKTGIELQYKSGRTEVLSFKTGDVLY